MSDTTLYTVVHVDHHQVLAEGLNDDAVAAWWKQNEPRYFGVRVEGNRIMVCDTERQRAENVAARVRALCPDAVVEVGDYPDMGDRPLVVVISHEMVIFDPFSGWDCRFPADPATHGLSPAAAQLIRDHNQITF